VTELASARGIDATDRIAAFQRINSAGRAEDEKRVREITRESVPEKLWSGAFEQLRNSKVTSQFAEKRSYFVDGQQISSATHYGFDLATTMNSPVTASNSGKVVWADDLGIYGGCVVVDHGRPLHALRSPLADRREAGRRGREGAGDRALGRDGPRRRRSPALLDAAGRRLRGPGGMVGPDRDSREGGRVARARARSAGGRGGGATYARERRVAAGGPATVGLLPERA
jgi:hypothetical protein